MKYLLPFVTCSLFSVVAAAGTATPGQKTTACTPQVPDCRSVMFELYGDLLFLQPNGSDLYYAAEAIPFDPSIAVPAVSPNWKIFEIDPDYQVGFEVGAKALFTDPNASIEASWERLHSHDTASHTAGLASDMIGPMFDIGPNSTAYQTANGKASFLFDAADLVFGKKFCFHNNLYAGFYAGAGFARIKQTLSSTYSNLSGSITRSISTYSKFIGAGPELGLSFDYRIAGGFFFTGASSAGLMLGQMENKTTYQSTTPVLTALSIPQPNVQTTSTPHRTQLIPSFEEKLGFAYAANFECWKLTFSAGYQAQIYLNAVQTVDMTAPQVLPSLDITGASGTGVFAVGFERTLSNFILTGPYIALAFDF